MIDKTDKWPDYLPEFGHDDLMAMGVIALNYGQLETRLKHLCGSAIGMKPAEFHKMNNPDRIKKLREKLPNNFAPELEKEIDYFLRCYNLCADNRHAVMHSSYGGEYSDVPKGRRGIVLSKYDKKTGQQLFTTARTSDLRKVADEIREVMKYGVGVLVNVNRFLQYGHKPISFDKPPMPTELKWEPLMKAPKPVNKVSKSDPIKIIIGRNKKSPQ